MEAHESDRMRQLKKLLEREPTDPFLLYGIAMEYKKAGNLEFAVDYFSRVLALDPGYSYAYHQRGLTYEMAGDLEAAKRSYREGIEAATKKGDTHAAEEIGGALMAIE